MEQMWKRGYFTFSVETKGKTEDTDVDKKSSIYKVFLRISTKVFSTTTVTKKRLVYVLFMRNMPAKF